MKSILISIQPEWCELIANGEKIVEVRKTKPKLDTPFKCYIYETKGRRLFQTSDIKNMICPPSNGTYRLFQGTGKIIGEFVCDRIYECEAEFTNDCYEDIRCVDYDEDIDEYIKTIITSNERKNPSDCYLCRDSCLSYDELRRYVFTGIDGFYKFYSWHISELKIYDRPKELSEFYSKGKKSIKRPPQSWCYVEELI